MHASRTPVSYTHLDVYKRQAKYRDESRLMVVHKSTGKIEHKVFKDILDYFDDKDVLDVYKRQL